MFKQVIILKVLFLLEAVLLSQTHHENWQEINVYECNRWSNSIYDEAA